SADNTLGVVNTSLLSGQCVAPSQVRILGIQRWVYQYYVICLLTAKYRIQAIDAWTPTINV
ncbi:hypothetical protein LTR22_027947, partial [Elasticomyces elasticus]